MRKPMLFAAVLLAAGTFFAGCCSGGYSNLKDGDAKYPQLKKVYDRMARGEKVKIAYLGGSITWGATATDPQKTSWRALYTKSLEEKFPNAHIKAIDAAIGGKGSDLGVFRMDRDVIAYKPDMTLVEFAVNDGHKDRNESFEGVLRKLHNSNPEMAIVVVIAGSGDKKFASINQDKYIEIANYYNLPYADVVNGVNRLILANKLKEPKLMLTDGCHPNDYGYTIYRDVVSDSLGKAAAESGTAKSWPAKPFTANRYESAESISLATLIKDNPDWRKEVPSVVGAWFDHQPSRWLDSVIVPRKDNAVLTVKRICAGVGVYFEMLPKGSRFEVLADGKTVLDVNTNFSQTNPGLGNRFVFLDGPAKERTITIRAAGRNLRLGNLLVTK